LDRILINGKDEEKHGTHGYKDMAEEMTYLYPEFVRIKNMRYILDRTYMPDIQKRHLNWILSLVKRDNNSY